MKSSAKSILRKGPAAGKKSNDFIAVKEDEPVTVVPIFPTGDIVSIDLHAFWVVNPAVTFACIKSMDDAGSGCPGCQAGDKPGYRAFLPVLDSEGDMKVFAFGISVERQLVTLEDELGTIVGLKLRVRRSGSGLSTKYQVINTGKEVDTSDIKKKDAETFIESKIEIKDRKTIVEEMKAAGLLKSGKATEEDDEEDEDLDEEDDIEETEDTEDEVDETEDDVDEKPVKKPVKKVAPVSKVVAKKPVKKTLGKKGKEDDWE